MREKGSIPRRILLSIMLVECVALLLGAARGSRIAPDETHGHTVAPPGVFSISDNVNLVLLDVSVKDRRGGFVTGLARNNFHVFEDGEARNITQFETTDTPVSIGLVVDNSGSMLPKRPEVITAGLSFAKQSNPKDEFFVVNFNNSVVRGLPANVLFTDNLQQIRNALYFGQPSGQTALYDAIAYSLKHLEYSRLEKRTLIVVSDGGDNVSQTNLPDLMKMIEASRATVYTVGLYDPEDHDLNPGVLRKIAGVSGGEFFEPAELNQIGPVLEKISQDIRNCYTIGYVPNEETDKRVVRNVKVTATADDRKLMVRTRTTYITTPLSQLTAQQRPQ